MKKFKYNFTPLIWVLLCLAILVAIITMISNITSVIKSVSNGYGFDIEKIIVIIVALLFLIFIIFTIFNSYYEITDTELKTRLGFIVSGVKLQDVKEIVLFVKNKRLSIIFKNEEFTNIIIKSLLFDDFIKNVKEKAPHIIYSPYEEKQENN